MIPLARQEVRIARMLVAGLRQPEIARELGIATNTVKTYVARIRAKTGYQRATVQLSFEVVLDRLLRAEHPQLMRPGTSCVAGLLSFVRHSPELSDAVRLMRAGFVDWRWERTRFEDGRRYSEWRARDGMLAVLADGRHLEYRAGRLELEADPPLVP